MNQKKTHFGRTNILHSISRTCSILEPRYLMSLSLVFATFCTWESLISRYWQDFWTLNLSFCSVFATFPTLNLDFISCSILEHVQSQISYLQGTCSIPKKRQASTTQPVSCWNVGHKNDSPLVVWSWKQVFVKHFGTWICRIVMLSWIVDWCWRSRVELKKCWRGRAGCGAHGVEPHVVGVIFFSCFFSLRWLLEAGISGTFCHLNLSRNMCEFNFHLAWYLHVLDFKLFIWHGACSISHFPWYLQHFEI